MESFVKQIRARFPGAGDGNKEAGSKERKPTPQRTQTFRGERRGLGWLKRQFTSRMMSRGYDYVNDPEHATAVAAAAYAITSLEESSRILDQKKKTEGPEAAPTRTMSKREGPTSQVPDPGRASRRLPGEVSLRISDGTERKASNKAPETPAPPPVPPRPPTPPPRKAPTEKPAVAPASSLKKVQSEKNPPAAGASSFKKPLNNVPGGKQDTAVPKPPPPAPPPPPPPPPPIKEPAAGKAEVKRERPLGEIEIDAWEKAEMAKIKEKYDKLNSEINSWSDNKKKKAKRKLDKTEGAPDQKRAKALRRYRTDIQNIDYVAGGAKAKAEEKRRNEEMKVREKASIIRATGQFPPTCSCF